MSGKMRPWDRPDVKVFRPDPVAGIEFDPKEFKAVDPATGEFLILRPGSGPDPASQFLYGTEKEGWVVSGGYALGGNYPDENVSVTFIRSVSLRSGKALSRSEYDAAPIARMMRGFADAEIMAGRAKDPLRKDLPLLDEVVIDTRPEKPTAR